MHRGRNERKKKTLLSLKWGQAGKREEEEDVLQRLRATFMSTWSSPVWSQHDDLFLHFSVCCWCCTDYSWYHNYIDGEWMYKPTTLSLGTTLLSGSWRWSKKQTPTFQKTQTSFAPAKKKKKKNLKLESMKSDASVCFCCVIRGACVNLVYSGRKITRSVRRERPNQ